MLSFNAVLLHYEALQFGVVCTVLKAVGARADTSNWIYRSHLVSIAT